MGTESLIDRFNIMKEQQIFKMLLNLSEFFYKSKEKNNVEKNFSNFLMGQTHKESKDFLREFISIVNNYCPDINALRYYTNSVNKLLKKEVGKDYFYQLAQTEKEKNTFDKIEPILNDFKIFFDMFCKFVTSNYMRFDGAQLSITIPILHLDDSVSDWANYLKSNNSKCYDCIIAKDGTIYLAIWEHELLCYWLSLNNIPVDGVLRVCQNPSTKTLSLSSLAPYKYHENTSKDRAMHLTDEQAKSLVRMFMKLSCGKRKYSGQTLEDLFCDNSENLGAGKYDERSNLKYNAYTLEEMAGQEIFYAKGCMDRVHTKDTLYADERKQYQDLADKLERR